MDKISVFLLDKLAIGIIFNTSFISNTYYLVLPAVSYFLNKINPKKLRLVYQSIYKEKPAQF